LRSLACARSPPPPYPLHAQFCDSFETLRQGNEDGLDPFPTDDPRVFATCIEEKFVKGWCCFNLAWTKEWLSLFDKQEVERMTEDDTVSKLGRQGEGDHTSLDDMLEGFGKPETLSKEDAFFCQKCKEHQPALKTIKIRRLPNVLIVGFKRFEYRTPYRSDKLSQFVSYPVDGLQVGRHAKAADDKDAVYDLFGVILHYGRAGFGHYVAYARSWESNGPTGKQGEMEKAWYEFDDGNVRRIKPEHVVTEHAYALFYRRRTFF
jgi:hypothetical protein